MRRSSAEALTGDDSAIIVDNCQVLLTGSSSLVTFTAAAESFNRLIVELSAIPAQAWDGPGLGPWDLRSLVGHASRSVSTVATYLRRPADREDVPDAATYVSFARRMAGADAAAVTERGRQAGIALGPDPAGAVRTLVQQTLADLDAVVGDPLIETIAGGMHVSSYLPTRTFELVVHGLDIAAATGTEFSPPPAASAEAVHLAAAAALRAGDGALLLRALTGRAVLEAGYSVV